MHVCDYILKYYVIKKQKLTNKFSGGNIIVTSGSELAHVRDTEPH